MLSGGKWTWKVQDCDDRKAVARCFLCKHTWEHDLSAEPPGERLSNLEEWLVCPCCGSASANYFVAPPAGEAPP